MGEHLTQENVKIKRHPSLVPLLETASNSASRYLLHIDTERNLQNLKPFELMIKPIEAALSTLTMFESHFQIFEIITVLQVLNKQN